jgi:hypothetical protein
MQRALTLCKTGHFVDGGEKDKKRKDFGDARWGEKAREWVSKTSEITRSRWDCILADAEAFVSADDEGGDDHAGDDGDESADPQTVVLD